jgi:hypothetical protein
MRCWRIGVALYELAPLWKPKHNGRRRKKEACLPMVTQLTINPATCWKAIMIALSYGRGARAYRSPSQPDSSTAAMGLMRDPTGKFATQALLAT